MMHPSPARSDFTSSGSSPSASSTSSRTAGAPHSMVTTMSEMPVAVAEPASQSSQDESQSQSQSRSQSQSQHIDTKTFALTIKKATEQSKSLQAKREKEIERNHKQRLSRLQKKIDEAHRKQEERAREIRRPNIQRLAELLHRRRELQTQLAHCFDPLAPAWTATINQIGQVVKDHQTACNELADASDKDCCDLMQ